MIGGLDSCMEGGSIMPSLVDRRRLKDRIVESISKAVKQIQEFQFCSGRADVTLTNNDWQFCKLVEHLDHAFLHGLRHITNGYWVIVQEFTHKATVKDISHLANVTTNLGRGRAWLYVALMEHLLESYLRCFQDNVKLVRRYYVKEAFVLDQQRMQILLTLSAGLEHVHFQLDLDMAYLDLSSSLRPRRLSREDSDDRLSLCSMDSSMSHSSSATGDLSSLSEQGDGTNLGITDLNRDSPKGLTVSTTGDTDTTELDEADRNRSRMNHISKILCTTSLDLDISGDKLEVIRVKTKNSKSRKKKSHRKPGENSGDMSEDSITSSPLSPEGNNSLMHCNGYLSDNASVDTGTCSLDKAPSSSDLETALGHTLSTDGIKDASQKGNHIKHETKAELGNDIPDPKDERHDSGCELSPHFSSFSQHAQDIEQRLQSLVVPQGSKTVAKDTEVLPDTSPRDTDLPQTVEQEGSDIYQSDLPCRDGLDKHTCKQQQNSSCDTNNPENLQTSSSHIVPPKTGQSNCDQIERDNTKTDMSCEEKPKSDLQGEEKTEIDQSCSEKTEIGPSTTGASCIPAESGKIISHEAEIRVDNNLLLLLMLHIFEDDDEHLLKLYQTSLGHTEGELQPVGLLLTTHAIYILSSISGEFRYSKDATICFKELDYISLGVSYQMINIVCTNRRKQFWVTTGDEQLTRVIISQLDSAVRNSDLDLPRLSVLTDATTQKIALRKWAAQECKSEVSDVAVGCYVLVHWEDMASSGPSPGREKYGGVSKEGVLLCKTQGGLGSLVPVFTGTVWKPSYFVLKDGIMYQYADKHDNSVPKMCLQLNGEDCGGCRRSPQNDRDHCFELILSDGSALQMSAPSEQEAQEWLQSLCQAVSEGMGYRIPGSGSLACCAVLTSDRLLMCHEDVQTNFFRTLGSASVTDVTTILTDSGLPMYAILVFESQEESVSSELWTLHFNSIGERDRFVTAMSSVWAQHFKVALPVSQVEDVIVQKRCRESHAHLKASKKM